jgi:predicted unusual protein kinase regulating ubiquinone biosynthesis (AarF/ABC1/UbiB family)
MERLYGKKLKELDDSVKNDYGRLVAQYSLKSVLYDTTYHADLHSGNIMFLEDDVEGDIVKKLGIIDFGIIGKITKDEQADLTQFFIKMFLNDQPLEAAKIIATRLVAPQDVFNSMTEEKRKDLYNDMAKTIQNILHNDELLDVMTIYKINKLLFNYGLTLSRPFCRIQLSLAVSASVSNELCNNGETYIDHIKNTMDKMINNTTCIMEY